MGSEECEHSVRNCGDEGVEDRNEAFVCLIAMEGVTWYLCGRLTYTRG
jgi:hypothetical protein